jgi:hypothetical protein
MERKIVIAWASRKRHIFIDGALLCAKEPKTKCGYSGRRRGGHLISYQIEMPDSEIQKPDEKYSHGEGIIPDLPLDEIKIGSGGIIRSSICTSCQKKYDKMQQLKAKH